MELFDIIKSFNNEKEWIKVTNSEKSKNLFMINRIMCVMHPLQSQGFNHIKIDPVETVNWWKSMISKKYSTTPGFIYTSLARKEKKTLKKEIPKEVIKVICEKFEISTREIKDLMEFYPKEFEKYCISVKEMIS